MTQTCSGKIRHTTYAVGESLIPRSLAKSEATMATPAPDYTDRFSGRVESYAQHRQGYPPEALSLAAKYFDFPGDGVSTFFASAI